MVKIENLTYNYIMENFKSGDIVSIFLVNNGDNKAYLIDYFTMDYTFIYNDLFTQLQELYNYNKNDNNSIYYSRLYTTNELKKIQEKKYIELK